MNSKTSDFVNRYKSGFKNLPHAVFKLIFPDTGLCDICSNEGEVICEKCLAEMEKHTGKLCEKCGRSVANKTLCKACQKHERPYDAGAIALFYQDKAQEIMKEFKFENKLPYAKFLAQEIYESIAFRKWEIDIVTAVPMHPLKLIGKGYNPPVLIAKKLAKKLGLKYNNKILKRIRYTKSMSLLKKIDRMEHSKKNFSAGSACFENKNVLIIDDVSTTGATLHICAEILKRHGAGKVYVAAACGDTF